MLKSMSIGKQAELELITFLESLGFNAKLNDNYSLRYEYDIIAEKNSNIVTFEVKYDVMSAKTNNIAIEYHNSKSNKPSGLLATKAKWWVHKIHDSVQICDVQTLKDFTRTETPVKMIEFGGDKNASLLIYEVERFKEICRDLYSIQTFKELL